MSLFAVDAMYHYSSIFPRHTCVMIQRQFDILWVWLRKWRMVINTEKSQVTCFTENITPKNLTLSLEGNQYPRKGR